MGSAPAPRDAGTMNNAAHDTASRTSRPAGAERSALLAGLGAAGMAAILLTLTGCSALAPYAKEQQKHYDTYADAPVTGDLAWKMPTWVPEDATDIDVRLHTEEPGYDIRFDSATGVDTAKCTPLDGAFGGPAIGADFLPEHLPTSGLKTCGDGRAMAEIDGAYYGWTTKHALPGDTTGTLRTQTEAPSAG